MIRMKFERITEWYRIFESKEDMENQVPLNRAIAMIRGGKKMCIAHSAKGFYAVNDKCPHNGFSLSQGNCSEDNAIVCPLHRYRFDLETGRAKSGIASYVDTYKLEVRENGVYVGVERTKFSLFG